jgi:TonB family protein
MRDERLCLKASQQKRLYILLVCALSLFCLSSAAFAQSGRRPVKKEPAPPAASPEAKPEAERDKQKANEDRVYMPREVDVKAKIKNRDEYMPSYQRGCPRSLLVTVRVVLHWSGKVTEAYVVKGMTGCAYDREAIKAARRFIFTPAMKDGHPVSQYVDVEYSTSVY